MIVWPLNGARSASTPSNRRSVQLEVRITMVPVLKRNGPGGSSLLIPMGVAVA